MAVQITRALVGALVTAYNDSSTRDTIAITRDGSIIVGGPPAPDRVWTCAPAERSGTALSFDAALKLLIALKASGAFDR